MSVIIPAYNIERHLAECLDSVAGQSLEDIEIICVDDGSTDGSPDILVRYASEDERFRVVTQANAGPGAARNAGLALATGEHVIFLDADDCFEPGFLEIMAARARETGADVTVCRAAEFDDATGRTLPSEWMLKTAYLPNGHAFAPEEAAEHIFQFTYGWPWDKLWRTAYVREAGLAFPALRHSEDLGFTFPGLAATKRIAVVDETLVHHRVDRASSVSNAARAGAPEQLFEAVCRLREDLEARGLYSTYERSFVRWAVEFLVWHTGSLGDGAVRRRCFELLRRKWLPAVTATGCEPELRDGLAVYGKYVLARYAPYPVFMLAWRIHQGAKKRKAK